MFSTAAGQPVESIEMEVERRIGRSILCEVNITTRDENFRNSYKEIISKPYSNSSLSQENEITCNSCTSDTPKCNSSLMNLELLTKVASRMNYDYNQPENREEREEIPEIKSKNLTVKPRKEKSLSILCDKFLKIYPLNMVPGNSMEISLDQATQFIGTDRRRIYDILIILECLQMASKDCKNHYQWHGTQHLSETLSQLKWLALKLGFFQNAEESLSDELLLLNEDCSNGYENLDVLGSFQMNNHSNEASSNDVENFYPNAASSKSGSQDKSEEDTDVDHKDSSLGVMCQKFLMLFLVKSKVITLDHAARILLGSSGVVKDCLKIKTKIRRLYDIANVLSSLELIRKVYVSTGNKKTNPSAAGAVRSGSVVRLNSKPAFQYVGPEVEPKALPESALVTSNSTRHSLLGHPSHAVSEKKCGRKRKTKLPCPLQPKQQRTYTIHSSSTSCTGSSFSNENSTQTVCSSDSGSAREKFPRSHSESCIGDNGKCLGSLRSDILQVAELELQRIFNEERKEKENSTFKAISSTSAKTKTIAPKSNWRHHHSENCISFSSNISSDDQSKEVKNNAVSWKSRSLKNSDSRLNSNQLTKSLLKIDQAATILTSKKANEMKTDMSFCIINRSNKSTVPIVIHSLQKNSRMRGVTINPVPISVSNCVMGPAYIIRQCTTDTTNINPVSVSLAKIDEIASSKELYFVEG